ncbi:MAG: hypothetical protein ACOCWC_05655 [Bacteroidota bacterium]
MILKLVNILMFIVMIAVNYLANALPMNGITTGELSAQYPNLFVPAGITFAIWGFIYLLLLGFIIMQFYEPAKIPVKAISWVFAISCLLNSLWIIAWHYEQLPLSLIIMLGLLLSLIFINYQLQGFTTGITKAAFGVYLGWICIATIANITALLVHYNWGGWGISEEAWTIIMIFAGVLITSFALVRLNNPFIGIAVAWAFLGIVIKQRGDYPSIVLAAIAAIVLISTLTLWLLIKGGGETKA